MKKTITNTTELSKALENPFSKKEEELIDLFFKKKVMHVVDKKIIYPKLEDIKKKIKEYDAEIETINSEHNFWRKNKNKVVREKNFHPIAIYFKKNFWRHKIKEITNKEYKQDVKDAKLNDRILLDPEYHNLFETFLVNPDYRKKLKETINNSIVYKYNQIGDYSAKKKDFKIKASTMKIEQIKTKILEIEHKKEVFVKIYEIIKKYS